MSAVQVSETERVEAKQRIFRIIRELEHATKPVPGTDSAINDVVESWEGKMFEKFGNNKATYQIKIQTKFDDCNEKLQAHLRGQANAPPVSVSNATATVQAAIVPATVGKSGAPKQVASTAASNPSRPVQSKPSAVTAAAATQPAQQPIVTRVPPTQAPVSRSLPPQQSAPVSSSVNRAPTNVPPQQTAPAKANTAAPVSAPTNTTAPLKEYRKIDELRDPLEQCRSILRVLNVFGMSRQEQALKEEFMKSFQRTTEVIKEHKQNKITTSQMEERVMKIGHDLQRLREKLDPRFRVIQQTLNAKSFEEVFELDAQPLGLLERVIEVNGSAKYTQRCRDASTLLGGRESFKKSKAEFS